MPPSLPPAPWVDRLAFLGMGVPTAPAPAGPYLLQGAELAAEVRGSGPVVTCSGNTQRWCGGTPKVPVWEAMSSTGQQGRLEWASSPGGDKSQGCSAGAGHRGIEHCINI